MKRLALLLLLSGCFPALTSTPVAGRTVVTVQHEFVNVHALEVPGGGLVLFDSGLERNAGRVEESLRQQGLDPSRVAWVVLSHGHADHAGGARHFQAAGAKVLAGKGDEPLLGEGRNDTLCPTSSDARARHAADQAERFQGLSPDVWLEAGNSLEALTGLPGAQAIAVPGHTPGSLVMRVGEAAFVGDLFRGSVFGAAAEVHFYMCDLEANRRDIARLLAGELAGVQTFFTGHFGPLSRQAVVATFGEGP